MQTFLPVPDFKESAKVLDMRRLGKQRVEAWQLVNALMTGPLCLYDLANKKYDRSLDVDPVPVGYAKRKTPWYNHPACVMWRKHEVSLCRYGMAMCVEWIHRGYKDTLFDKLHAIQMFLIFQADAAVVVGEPSFIGDERFHASHRSNLLRKDPEWYGNFGWQESSDLPYVWPAGARFSF